MAVPGRLFAAVASRPRLGHGRAAMFEDFAVFVAIGFAAQLVDGALGMAFGLISTSVLLGMGVPPATASAAVHAAEIVTTGASGYSHFRLGNVDRALFRKLVLPGVVGGVIGATALASVPGELIKPFVNAYLIVMGLVVVFKGLRRISPPSHLPRAVRPLGFCGGLFDAMGGGGWGPIVTSTLLGWGAEPRRAIGTSNAVEFFVASAVAATFVLAIGLDLWPIILGLVIGGAVAAPLAAYAAKLAPPRPLMLLVGAVVIALSLRDLVGLFAR